MTRIHTCLVLFLVLFFPTGCGTRTGNPSSSFSLKSSSYNVNGSFLAYRLFGLRGTVSEFKFCVKRVRLETETDDTVGGDSNGEIDIDVGLVDASSGNEVTWGTTDLPTDFTLKRAKVKMSKDSDLCPGDYSVRFNGVETDEEVEFEFNFEPAVRVDEASSQITFALQLFVDSLLEADDASNLTPETLKQRVEQVEAAAEVE